MARKDKGQVKVHEPNGLALLDRLTMIEEEKLRGLYIERNEQLQMLTMEIEEPSGVVSEGVMEARLCLGCLEPLKAVGDRWFMIFVKIRGCYCSNPSCEFYRKFIPVKKKEGLIFERTIPINTNKG